MFITQDFFYKPQGLSAAASRADNHRGAAAAAQCPAFFGGINATLFNSLHGRSLPLRPFPRPSSSPPYWRWALRLPTILHDLPRHGVRTVEHTHTIQSYASQAADLAAQATANQDTKLAAALVASLVAQIGTPSPATVSLESSAGSAAIVASGAGSSLTNLITTLNGSGTPSSATLISLLATVQAGVTPNVVTALTYLADPTVSGSPASSGLSATDYAIAAIVIAASVLPPGTDPSTSAAAALLAASPKCDHIRPNQPMPMP